LASRPTLRAATLYRETIDVSECIEKVADIPMSAHRDLGKPSYGFFDTLCQARRGSARPLVRRFDKEVNHDV